MLFYYVQYCLTILKNMDALINMSGNNLTKCINSLF